jgi:2-haloacid dehalogenase
MTSAAAATMQDIGACVFDAYGTLFDYGSAAARCKDALGADWERLSDLWRRKQVEYTWLRSLMGRHTDFWHVTGESLDYALAAVKRQDPALRATLMQQYLSLDPFPEVPVMLQRLKAKGMRVAILSNGSPTMLTAAVNSAGLSTLIDMALSVEAVGVYKPHASVYQLAVDKLGVPAQRICFLSSNGWDAAGAAAFGFRVAWVNRGGMPQENLPGVPERQVRTLAELPALLGFA